MEIAHVASISLEYDMKEGIRQHDKRCPACKKEYPEEDNYCGDDGSALEQCEPRGLNIYLDRLKHQRRPMT